jgi:hypothetical protein
VRNNIYYIESADGITWNNFANKVNVTNYGLAGDSLYAYTEVSAVYDYNDNLHAVWNSQYAEAHPASGTLPGIYYTGAHLAHWDKSSNTIHYFASFDDNWLDPTIGCKMGGWNFVYCKFSVAVNPFPSQQVWVAYTSWDSTDCSYGNGGVGWANGDIYLQESRDNGATWGPKVNMTNSQTPGCLPGDCDSDNWSSLAEYTYGDSVHLFYVNDKDAGGIAQTEGTATDNPMLYLAYHVERIPQGVSDDIEQPKNFSLSQNYPNPFNAHTNIDFELTKAATVNLSVYDITGAKVTTLINGHMDAGNHQVNWNASGIASGVYYYTLRTNGSETTKKMTLLK